MQNFVNKLKDTFARGRGQTEEESSDPPAERKIVSGAPQPDSSSGQKFNKLYSLGVELGTGAFSVVKEGKHKSNPNKVYAIKIVDKKQLTEEDSVALVEEIAILREFDHPNIIGLYDVFEDPSTFYLVTEHMSGGELFDRIVEKTYYNEKEARDTCKILLEAIGYCHANSVAHRDLKPENLLLQSKGDDSAVKIADFGFAKRVLEPNSLTTQCGTPGYVAPEILNGIAYDTKADMWSVGVILYILLGGYPPGQYEFHEEYWGGVSQEAKDLISSLILIDTNRRLSAQEALQNKWILEDDEDLAKKDLGANLEEFKKFNAKRKFKAAVKGVVAINKLTSLGENFRMDLEELAL